MTRIIFIILLNSLFLFSSELVKSGDTIVDKKHNLIWQDHKDNIRVIVTHEHAIEYCNKLSQSGSTNWRVPSIKEYKYILDKSRDKEELMINRAFYYINQGDYWASDRTWLRNFGLYAYYIYFKSGTVYYQNRTYPKYIRCVRDI
jgi:hypothetical protein